MITAAESVEERLRTEQLVAVLRAPSVKTAVVAGRALAQGGVRAIEVAFTTPGAAGAIEQLCDDSELIVGAGTVLSRAQALQALDAGAQFLISPGLVPEVLDVAEEREALAIPGVLTPTEVAAATRRAKIVKLFPASLGGRSYLRALLGPFPGLRVIPTGGVNAGNACDWLEAGAFALGAGSDLCPPELIAAADRQGLASLAEAYREALAQRQEGRK